MSNPLDEWVPETPWEQEVKDYANERIKELEAMLTRDLGSGWEDSDAACLAVCEIRVAKLEDAFIAAEKRITALKRQFEDATLGHCSTCSNKNRIDGESQETYCEQCVFQRTWRQDHLYQRGNRND